jgi:hypothetical protein
MGPALRCEEAGPRRKLAAGCWAWDVKDRRAVGEGTGRSFGRSGAEKEKVEAE